MDNNGFGSRVDLFVILCYIRSNKFNCEVKMMFLKGLEYFK